MKRSERVLLFVILLEVIGAAYYVVRGLRQPVAPRADLRRLDQLTADRLDELRRRAFDDTLDSWKELAEACVGFGYNAEAEVCYQQAARFGQASSEVAYAYAHVLDRMGRLTEST